MAVQRDAPVAACQAVLLLAAERSLDHALAGQLAASALGSLPPVGLTLAVQSVLAALVQAERELPVRLKAAHAIFRLKCLPDGAHNGLCALLFEGDMAARQTALLAIVPFAAQAGPALVAAVRAHAPAQWTREALTALVRSAAQDAAALRRVEQFLLLGLRKAPDLLPAVGVFAALALVPSDAGPLQALTRIACDPQSGPAAAAAAQALGELGEAAQSQAAALAQCLPRTDDTEREELLCRSLVQLRCPWHSLPLDHVLQRLAQGPERAAAAHCMLLALHPREAAQAVPLLCRRHAQASAALRPALAATCKALGGPVLKEPEPAPLPAPQPPHAEGGVPCPIP